MTSLLLVGDIHLSDRPPSSCTDTYLEDIFTLLEHTVEKAKLLNVDAVVWAGDVFHHKQPSRTSHRTVQRAIEIVKSYDRLLIVPGNHDMLNDRFDSLAETQPLGVLLQAGGELLRGWASDLPLYGVPWLQRFDDDEVSSALVDWRDDSRSCPAVVVAHAPLYPPSMELPYEFYPASSWADAMENTGYCYYGHVHEAHGEYTVKGVRFCNQGAITRGSLHESELSRKIAVTLWSDGKGNESEGFHRVEIPHKPADQVFRLMEKREAQDAQAALDEFLASVDATTIEITSIESVLAHIRTMELDPGVLAKIEELLVGG